MRPPRLLQVVEVLSLALFVSLLMAFVWQADDEGSVVPLDVAALSMGPAQERWYGIFLQGQHVGFSMSRATPAAEGATLFEQRSSFRVATFGKIQEIITAGTALVDPAGVPRRFDFFMVADQVRLSVRGEVQDTEIVMDVEQAGETSQLRFPVERPPQISTSFEHAIASRELALGTAFSVPYFDPVTMAEGEMEVEVVGVEVLENGEEAFWLNTSFLGVEARALVTPAGETVRQTSAMGLESVRMTKAAAQAVPASDEPVDLIAHSAVALSGRIPAPRKTRSLAMRISGVEAELVPDLPPWQVRKDDLVRIEKARPETIPDGVPREDREAALDETDPLAPYLEHSPTLPVAHPEVLLRVDEVVASELDRKAAAALLVDHVFEYVEKVPSIGVPNGLEVLRSARGDCNEHTALYVTLARAAGLPARIAAGVVYSDRIGARGAFYYHAWPEVLLGPDPSEPSHWVPVDPTFGQFPADATHVKLIEGDLDKQIGIMAVMGKLAFALEEVE